MRLLGIIKLYLLTALVGICSAQDSVDVASNTVIFDRDPRWLQLSDSGNHPIKVIVDDQVEDGCWTNSVSAANAVKLELKRSGFDVTPTNEDSFPHHLVIMALGYSNGSSSCLIYYNLQFDMIDVNPPPPPPPPTPPPTLFCMLRSAPALMSKSRHSVLPSYAAFINAVLRYYTGDGRP